MDYGANAFDIGFDQALTDIGIFLEVILSHGDEVHRVGNVEVGGIQERLSGGFGPDSGDKSREYFLLERRL